MLINQGIDILEVERVRKILYRFGEKFIKKVFSENEIKSLDLLTNLKSKRKIERFSSRFAAKEAASKALGTGFRQGVRFKDIEILNLDFGKPTISFKGMAKKVFESNKIKKRELKVDVSMSNEKKYAIAIVTISSY